MALVAGCTGDVFKMALTRTRAKPLVRLIDALVKRGSILSHVLGFACIMAVLLLPLMERLVKFDEKALIAGAAIPTIRQDSTVALNIAASFMAQARTKAGGPNFAEWLVRQLQNSPGLEVHVSGHQAPHRRWPMPGLNCTNIHAVLRAARGDGKESIVLVTPAAMGPDVAGLSTQTHSGTALGLAAVMALMQHLHSITWLAKDIIWVVPDATCGATLSLQHWVRLYQMPASQQRHQDDAGRAGIMQQAVVLEAVHDRFDTMEVLVEGFNGQLPKLDSFQLLKYYAEPRLFAAVAVRGQRHQPQWPLRLLQGHKAVKAYAQRLLNMIQFMWQQATGLPTGPHAAFKEIMVDAATLRLTQQKASPSTMDPTYSMVHIAEVLELSVRSLNNLIERFHHSSFLYLLTDMQHYVTVEHYIVPLVLLLLCLVLQAAYARRLLQQLPSCPSCNAMAGPSWAGALRSTALLYGIATGAGLLMRQALCASPGTAASGSSVREGSTGSSQGYRGLSVPSLLTWLMASGWEGSKALDSRQAALAACIVVMVVACAPELLGLGCGVGDSHTAQLGQQRCTASKGRHCPRSGQARRLQERVVALSLVAVVLAGLACINWALAFAVAVLLVPLSAWTCPIEAPVVKLAQPGATIMLDRGESIAIQTPSIPLAKSTICSDAVNFGNRSASNGCTAPVEHAAYGAGSLRQPSRQHNVLKVVRLLVVMVLSPMSLLCVLEASRGHIAWTALGLDDDGHAIGEAAVARLLELVCDTWGTTYMMVWAAYVPVWVVCMLGQAG